MKINKNKLKYFIMIGIVILVVFFLIILKREVLMQKSLHDLNNYTIQDGINVNLYSNTIDMTEFNLLITVQNNEKGIKKVILPNDEKEINVNGKNICAFDYKIEAKGNYTFKYIDNDDNLYEKNINVTDEFISEFLKFNIEDENNIIIETNANIEYKDLVYENIEYKLGENNKWTKYTDNSEILLNSYNLMKYKNTDNTITIYARANDTHGNIVIIKKTISNLDLDPPITPTMRCSMDYPIITNYGVGLIDATLNITYDEREGISNYYSYDKNTWIKYTEPIAVKGTKVYLKSVKDISGLETSAEYKINGSATNTLDILAYDGNSSTYISALGTKRINVDSSAWGRKINIKWTRSGYDFAGDGSKSAYMNAYDKDGKVINSGNRGNTYTILDNTAYLLFCGTNAGRIYEISLVADPINIDEEEGKNIILESGIYKFTDAEVLVNKSLVIPPEQKVSVIVENELTIDNRNNMKSAIDIGENAVLNLYANAQINAISGAAENGESSTKGGHGKGGKGGYAGIHVPETATLNIYGTSPVYAYGGDAGDGGDTYSYNTNLNGGGGGGAGAGIGGNGGNGNDANQFESSDGFDGENAGNINIENATVYAYGGSGGSGGRTYVDGGGRRRISCCWNRRRGSRRSRRI